MDARRRAWKSTIALLAVICYLTGAVPALACSLDGIASLSMNGERATLTAGSASPSNAHYWAPFTLPAAARGESVKLSEDRASVSRSLNAAQLRTPFRWAFDDGTFAQGWTVTHRFAQLGQHRFSVSYYWSAARRWVEFDSAELQVVPPGDLLRANLGYHLENIAGTVLITVLRVLVWGSAIAILAAAVYSRRRRSGRTVRR